MSSPVHSQLSLSESPEKLKKSCICKIDNRRCKRKRAHAKDDEIYDKLLDDMTLNWPNLDPNKQITTAEEFAERSVCNSCLKENKHLLVKADFLAEKAAHGVASPSRRAGATPANTNATAPHMPNRQAASASHQDSDIVAENHQADTAAESGDGQTPEIDTPYALSQTFGATPHRARPSPLEPSSSPAPPTPTPLASTPREQPPEALNLKNDRRKALSSTLDRTAFAASSDQVTTFSKDDHPSLPKTRPYIESAHTVLARADPTRLRDRAVASDARGMIGFDGRDVVIFFAGGMVLLGIEFLVFITYAMNQHG